ncbi:MAG: hypothetical protein DRP18_03740 [Candidatus Aenigmatarchaeota archaeon]|nr:MAG: hypothetical protein DRP18_03740 [Candidatus Aenigmarchaeota archaeon]
MEKKVERMKAVYKFKNGKEWVEHKECHPRALPLSSRYIYPYWFDAIKNVYSYEKARNIQEIHKLVDDSRIKKGLELYRNGHIVEYAVTKEDGGDARVTVLSEDKEKQYTVVIKNYLPAKPPQFLYERENFIANLHTDCTCQDHIIGHYKDNSSLWCKHITAVLWLLQDKFDMPKIFVMPEERMVGYKKSDVVELATRIKAMPLLKYSYYINILLLKKYRGMKPAIGISIHKEYNPPYGEGEVGKPIWLTYTEPEKVKEIIDALEKGYEEMVGKKRRWWKIWRRLRTI